ncbi:MAG: alkyl sulfatase dimerization domain-containing protein [Muribaculaceae bacterium]
MAVIAVCLCVTSYAQDGQKTQASSYTKDANEAIKNYLPFSDMQDFKDAKRGFMGTIAEREVRNSDGSLAFSIKGWDFLDKESPATANPSLWRQSQLNRIDGLFEVVAGKVYQIRGFDLANMTFVRSDNGWIVIDVTSAKASAKAGYDLIKKHFGNLPIKAVVFTHPHVDHYWGIDAIIEGAPNKDIQIIAPTGFITHAIGENVMAGVAMGRRATYMYGLLLPKNEKGSIGTGLGQTNATGQKGIAIPTTEIGDSGEKLTIDGLDMEFIYAPDTEAPSEIMIYFPAYKAFCVAEEINRTMHNLLTLRGAKVRNGLAWSKYIDEAIVRYGNEVEVSFSTHHWPTWGNKEIVEYWSDQRDMYRYIHDQTLHLANKGLTPNEIAEKIKLPESMDKKFYNRGYYGTLSHNSKAQYQMYFGWYDGNPANLNPLPPVELGKKYVSSIGGEKKAMKIARKSYDDGEYRWAATLLNNVVFANPKNIEAKQLLADTYSQLGYQAESGPWRNFYLTGAQELMSGCKNVPTIVDEASLFTLLPGMLFDFMAIQINGEKAVGEELIINITLTDIGEKATLILKNGALTNRLGVLDSNPTSTIAISKIDLTKALINPSIIDQLSITGDRTGLIKLLSMMDKSNPKFNIIEP